MLIMENETQTISVKTTQKNTDVLVIILLNKSPNFKNFLRPFDLEIYGKKMWKYIELACSDYEVKTTFCTPETDVINSIKPMLNSKKYTLVLFSDTPLIQKSTIEDIITFAKAREINAINLPRGYIFNTEYLRTMSKIQNSVVEKFGDKDFMTITDLKSFEKISNIIKKRILDFHTNNGILIHDYNSTFIDADCAIESGVILEPNNTLKGKTFVGKGTLIKSGNYLENCIIKENCIIQNSFMKNALIEKESIKICEKIVD